MYKYSFVLLVIYSFLIFSSCGKEPTSLSNFGSLKIDVLITDTKETQTQKNQKKIENVKPSYVPNIVNKSHLKDYINIEMQDKHNTFSFAQITSVTVIIEGMDPVSFAISGASTSKTIDEITVGSKQVTVELKNSDDIVYYTQTRSVLISSNDIATPVFNNFQAVNEFITVLNPNGNEDIYIGSTIEINWARSHNKQDVKLELYKNGSFYQTISLSEANDGNYSWTIPSNYDEGNAYKLRVSSLSSPITYDESDANFKLIRPSITIVSPNGGENWILGSTQPISWSISGLNGNINIELYKNGSAYSTIASSISNDGNYSWTIPISHDESDNYKIRVSSTSNPAFYDESDESFTLSVATLSWMQTGMDNGNVIDIEANSQGTIFALWRESGAAWDAKWQLIFSNDNGDNWAVAHESLVGPTYTGANQFIAINSNDRILVGDGTKILFSDDNGSTWSTSDMTTNYDFEKVESIAVAPNGDIYAGRRQNLSCSKCGIFKSTDNGNSFQWIYKAPHGDEVYRKFIFKPDGTIFAGALWFGYHSMYKSTNNGSSWSFADDGLPDYLSVESLAITQTGRLILSGDNSFQNGGGFHYSDNNGNTWNRFGTSREQMFGDIVIDNNNNIYAFSYTPGPNPVILGYLSEDNGNSWEFVPDNGFIKDSDHSPRSSTITPSQYIFIGTIRKGIIRSTYPVK